MTNKYLEKIAQYTKTEKEILEGKEASPLWRGMGGAVAGALGGDLTGDLASALGGGRAPGLKRIGGAIGAAVGATSAISKNHKRTDIKIDEERRNLRKD